MDPGVKLGFFCYSKDMFNKLKKIKKASNDEKFLKKNWLLILAVLYVILPVDLIPDVLPVLGLGDDVLVLIATGLIKYFKGRKGEKEDIIEGELVND